MKKALIVISILFIIGTIVFLILWLKNRKCKCNNNIIEKGFDEISKNEFQSDTGQTQEQFTNTNELNNVPSRAESMTVDKSGIIAIR